MTKELVKKIVELENTSIWRDENLVWVKMHSESKITIENTGRIISNVGALVGELPSGLVIDATAMRFITADARKQFAETSNPNIKGVAIIVNSSVQKNFANLYLIFARPVMPTRLFTNQFEAAKWLNQLI